MICRLYCLKTNKSFITYDNENNIRKLLKRNKCTNEKLQKDWNKYGTEQFTWEVLASKVMHCRQTKMKLYFIAEFRSDDPAFGYNIKRVSSKK